ncbi:MAG: flagellar hook-length control protein FliK [Hydrogenophaga sp.]|uniref:flagellar hook-length control protein FliK n=1 Tax=Hydrogenophaga sp. TaxID=1904254 RepID=UPI0025BB4830|nr:flagellar hook-length control protein FliK [Hydrogenophaga sp.]MBU7572416.1 flagellar hook-length control protein FliK [Hydrogenophaga sp.]
MNAASPILNLAPAVPAPIGAAPVAPSADGQAALPGDFADLLAVGEGAEPVEDAGPTFPTEIGLLDEEPAADDGEQARDDGPAEPTEAMLSAALAKVQWTVGVERALQLALRSSQAAPPAPAAPPPGAAPVALFPTSPAPATSLAAVPAPADAAVSDASTPLPAAAPAGQGSTTADAGARAPRFELPPVQPGPAAVTAPAGGGTFVLEGDSVRLPAAEPDLWQRPLAQALGDRLQVQASQGIEQARIRLEPPALGRIDIVLRQEAGQLQVQLSASHHDVVRQLQAMGEGLRQELTHKQGSPVTVQVFEDRALADGRSSHRERQHPPQQEDRPGQGLLSESKADRRAFSLA